MPTDTELTLFCQYFEYTSVLHQRYTEVVAKCHIPKKDLKLVALGKVQHFLSASVPNDFAGNSGHFESCSPVASPAVSKSLAMLNNLEATSVFHF